MQLDSKMMVSEFIRVHSSTVGMDVKRKMLCIGCPTETFYALEDVIRIHGIAMEQLMKELRRAIDAQIH
jgi:hybrid cluster-associated redox disulfide protein